MTLTATKFAGYMKERWLEPDAVRQAIVQNCPLLGMMRKKEDCGGRYTHVPFLSVGPQGRSITYATAKTNAVGSDADGFDVTYGNNYHIAKLEGNVIDRCKGNDNALFDALDNEMEGSIAAMYKDFRLQLFNNTGGARGQVGASGISTVYLTLKDPESSIHFEKNMEICIAATDGTSGSLRDSGNAATITHINRSAGILTTDSDWTSQISGATDDDYLFVEGDFGSAWAGILSWVPASAPGATAFFGVDRSVDTDRLGGQRYDGTGEPIESAFSMAAAYAQHYDAKPGLGVLNPIKWAELSNSLGADRQNRITTVKGNGTKAVVGYDAIMVATPMGQIPVISDPGCHKKYGLLLDMSTWTLLSVGKFVRVIDDDGLTIRRGTGDDWLVEFKALGNFACNAPGRNVRLTLES